MSGGAVSIAFNDEGGSIYMQKMDGFMSTCRDIYPRGVSEFYFDLLFEQAEMGFLSTVKNSIKTSVHYLDLIVSFSIKNVSRDLRRSVMLQRYTAGAIAQMLPRARAPAQSVTHSSTPQHELVSRHGNDSPTVSPPMVQCPNGFPAPEKGRWNGWKHLYDDIPNKIRRLLVEDGVNNPGGFYVVDGSSCFYEHDPKKWLCCNSEGKPLFLDRRQSAGPVIVVFKKGEYMNNIEGQEHHLRKVLSNLTKKQYPIYMLTINVLNIEYVSQNETMCCRLDKYKKRVAGDHGKPTHLHCEFDDVAVQEILGVFANERSSNTLFTTSISKDAKMIKTPQERLTVRDFMNSFGNKVTFELFRLGPNMV